MKKYNPKIHHRRSIRLKGYDYSQAGLYFVTIATQNQINLFGKIAVGVALVATQYCEQPHYGATTLWGNHIMGQPQGIAPTIETVNNMITIGPTITSTIKKNYE